MICDFPISPSRYDTHLRWCEKGCELEIRRIYPQTQKDGLADSVRRALQPLCDIHGARFERKEVVTSLAGEPVSKPRWVLVGGSAALLAVLRQQPVSSNTIEADGFTSNNEQEGK